MRRINGRFLSQDERIEIADLRQSGMSIWRIADQLGHLGTALRARHVLTSCDKGVLDAALAAGLPAGAPA